jgi:hypothetical protein
MNEAARTYLEYLSMNSGAGYARRRPAARTHSVQIDTLAKADLGHRRKGRSDCNRGNRDHDQGHVESNHLIENASDFFSVIAIEAIIVGRVPHRELLARIVRSDRDSITGARTHLAVRQ